MNMTMSNRTAKASRLTLFSIYFVLSAMLPQLALADGGSGQRLYRTHCAGCHGTKGISVMPQAQNFSRVKLLAQPDQDLIDIIRSGRNMMPAYLGILNDNETLDVIKYLRTLN